MFPEDSVPTEREPISDWTIGSVPEWGPACLDDMVGTLLSVDSPFPCTFAVAAAKKRSLRFGFVDDLDDEDTWEPLVKIVSGYLDVYRMLSQDTSLVVFFRPDQEPRAITDYHKKFWSVLQFLHDRDPARWPAAIPGDPEHPLWEFSFGGTPIFVVCNTPSHELRRSRNSPGFVITFQPRWVFQGLDAGTPRGDAARRVIRKRLRAFDGMAPSEELGNYGDPDNREWRQYFLPDRNTDDAFGCPFLARIAAQAEPVAPVPALDPRRELRRKLLAEAGLAVKAPVRVPVAHAELPLSSAQRRMWVTQRIDPDSAAYNLCAALRLLGPLDVPTLAAAVDRVVARHDVLRTTYHERPDGTVFQRVEPATDGLLTVGSGGVEELVRVEGTRPFELDRESPLRVFLIPQGETDHVLVVVIHHIACDDSTWSTLFADISAAYRADLDAARPTQYAEFVTWERSAPTDDLHYWRTVLTPDPGPLALPTDRPRAEIPAEAAGQIRRTLPPRTLTALREFGRTNGATPFMVLLALTNAVLHRWTGQSDIAIGSPTARRDQQRFSATIGNFGNTVVLREHVRPEETFRDLLRRARTTSVDAFSHAGLPFDTLVTELEPAREPGHSPLFDVLFSVRSDLVATLDLPAVQAVELPVHNGTTQFDLEIAGVFCAAGLTFELTYRTELFDHDTVNALLTRLAGAVETILADPDVPIADLPALPARLRSRVLDTWNDTSHPVDPRFVPELFAARAAEQPDALAVDDVTYRELDEWADRVVHGLRSEGVQPGDLVAVLASRSPAWIAGLLGVWRAGAVYLPLDPAHPKARIDTLLREAAPVAVLTDEWLTSLDTPSTPVEPVALPDDAPAYLLHTSGTSGTPKGVLTTRRGVRNYLAWGVQNYPDLRGTSLLHSPVTTDMTVLTVFGALLAGGRLRTASLDEAPAAPVADFIDFTPSHLRLGTALPGGFVPTGQLVLGGEALSGELLAPWLAEHPGVAVSNEYGPTETVVGCVAHRVENVAPGPVPIGRPIWNTRCYVLDARLNPVPPGETGELYVAGDGVALGYLGQPASTAGRFVADPFGVAGSRMYRTGDLARWNADGLLYCLGRADDQLSVHGFRVEPGEIEAALRALPGVRAAAVAIAHNQLVGCVVGAADLDLLREQLPAHLVPARVFSVEALPLTANGKLDVARLPVVDVLPGAAPAEGPVGAICALFAEALCLPEVGPDDSLFRLGGDSMTAIQLVSRGRDSGLVFTAKDVFQLRTPARLAEVVTAAPSAGEQASDAVGLVPPTPIMRWARARGGSIDRLNQSVVFRTPAGARWDQIVDVLQAVLDRHDMLRADLEPATWNLRVPPAGTVPAEPLVHWVDAEALDDDQLAARIAAQRAVAVGRLDPSAGVMLRAAWFDAGSRPGRLLLVVHHLVVDGMSWGILAADLAAAWQRQPLSRRGTAFRTWATALDATDVPRADNTETPLGSRFADPARDTADTGLRRHSTMPIVPTELAEAYRVDVQDILLAGLVRAIGRAELLVDVESHGRDLLPGADVGRTVGWFTALRPVRLDGSVRPITDAPRAEAAPQIGFNYLGRAFTGGAGDWSIVAEADWAADTADGPFTRTLEVDLRIVDEQISVLWQWPAALLSEADIRKLADDWLRALDAIRADAPRTGGLTSADLDLVSLSQDEIDELEGGWSAE